MHRFWSDYRIGFVLLALGGLFSFLTWSEHHPEGDVLYHLLQCYVLAVDELPYDEEFQLAALLHDVGKIVLTNALEGSYTRLIEETEKNERSLIEAEKSVLGADHAEAFHLITNI